ncbi:MAG TPA: WXG100 family type VII secretion target [Actinomycetes bacterium]|nr:WXG100 family type VII secretion target [Actinomycetes bacterium]
MSDLGDHVGVRLASQDLARAGDDLDELRRALDGLVESLAGRSGTWAGPASEAFSWRFMRYAEAVGRLVDELGTASAALARLSAELEAARQEAEAVAGRAQAVHVAVDPAAYRLQPVLRGTEPHGVADLLAEREVWLGLQAAHEHAERARRRATAELAPILPSTIGRYAGSYTDLDKVRQAVMSPVTYASTLAAWADWKDRRVAAAKAAKAGTSRGSTERAAARARLAAARSAAARAGARADEVAHLARLPPDVLGKAARGVPVLDVLAFGAGVAGDADRGVPAPQAVAANGASIVAAEAATVGATAIAGTVGAPVVVGVIAVAVVGYGVGTAAHSLIAYGDLREFGEDSRKVKGATEVLGERMRGNSIVSSIKGVAVRLP